MARGDWLSRSPRRSESRWERWSGRERSREREDVERGYGARYGEGWAPEGAGLESERARRARERWGADWWGEGGYGGYEGGYGPGMPMRRRGEPYRRPWYDREEETYGSPYYDRLPFRSRRRYEGGEYGWEGERRYFRPYDREFQAGYGEPYRGRVPGYTGEYGWAGRPGYRPYREWRSTVRRGAGERWRGAGPYGHEYGW
ncbi:MAG: hypothetical protein DIU52_007125 [bacterium]|jgi:hypothetical protein|nr:MAG: hypothetical protein DIU52_11115 [bacterium]